MANKHVVKITMVSEFFLNHKSQFIRGENSYESGYVVSLHYDSTVTPPLIKGVVSASMKKQMYNVEMVIIDNDIKSMTCTCPRGQDICHHMASFALYCHYNLSVTDVACTWNRPKSTVDDVDPFKKLYPAKPYSVVKTGIQEENFETFKVGLRNCNARVFSWLLRPQSNKEFISILPDINNIIYSEEYLNSDNKILYLKNKCKLQQEDIGNIEKITRGQTKNENWLIGRKGRLTASRFGKILAACKKDKYPPSFYKNLLGAYNLDGIKAIQWGRENEVTTLNAFTKKFNFDVTPSGLWLHECGYLGASPDGIINDDIILEIKCPYKFRNITTPLRNNLHDKSYIVYYEDSGESVLNVSHQYYHQIQGQLYLTNRTVCYLIIWTPNDFEVYHIEKDPNWEENISILQNFYFENYIPYLLNISEK